MTDTEIIASMARELAETKEKCSIYSAAIKEAELHFVCIGGPLNDNNLGFNKEQRNYLHKIYHCLEVL